MAKRSPAEEIRLTLGVLNAAEGREGVSQRSLASELGVALGLVNAYVKRCVRKGLVKVHQVPAQRYRYYLTPAGFAEKARLTSEYLSASLAFFRRAKAAYSETFDLAEARGWKTVAVLGRGDLADIASICAMEHGITVLHVIGSLNGTDLPSEAALVRDAKRIARKVDGFIVAQPALSEATLSELARCVGGHYVLWPKSPEMGFPASGAFWEPT